MEKKMETSNMRFRVYGICGYKIGSLTVFPVAWGPGVAGPCLFKLRIFFATAAKEHVSYSLNS